MITEDYISFKIAKLLKEKGFDEICRAFWKEWNGEINLCDCNSFHTFEYCHNTMLERYNDNEETNIAAPTLQMVMKWLRKVHHIFIDIDYDIRLGNKPYFTIITDMNKGDYFKGHNLPTEKETYEAACEAAIKYCLENLV